MIHIRKAEILDIYTILDLMQDCNDKYNLGIEYSTRVQNTLQSFIKASRINLLVKDDLVVGYVILTDYVTLFNVYELGIISMYIKEKYLYLIRTLLRFIKEQAEILRVQNIRISTDLGFIDNRLMKLLALNGYKTIGFTSLYTL